MIMTMQNTYTYLYERVPDVSTLGPGQFGSCCPQNVLPDDPMNEETESESSFNCTKSDTQFRCLSGSGRSKSKKLMDICDPGSVLSLYEQDCPPP